MAQPPNQFRADFSSALYNPQYSQQVV